jgi:hypothetical protein
MKWLAVAAALGSLIGCAGGSSPTAPTPPPPANVAGDYHVTLTASTACSGNLPSSTRVLNYLGIVTQNGTSLQVQLLAHVIWHTMTVTGTVAGQSINFSSFSFSETTTGGGVALVATGAANIAPDGSIAGTLNGTFQGATGSSCTAASHQIQMVRR